MTPKRTPHEQCNWYKKLRKIFSVAMISSVVIEFVCSLISAFVQGNARIWILVATIICAVSFIVNAILFACFTFKFNMAKEEIVGVENLQTQADEDNI